MQNELLALLAARRGHFALESGHHGDLWLDLDLLFQRPGQLRQFVTALAQRLAQYKAVAICGPLVGGALLAQAIATELDLEFYYTERVALPPRNALYAVEYRLPRSLGTLLPGKDVLIVDDVVNAGSAVRGTVAALSLHGARPVAAGALLVLGATGASFLAEHNIPLESIAALPNNLWEPDACPLCAAQMPLATFAF